MAKTDINENIYRAIDTIIDARLQNVNFNSTVLCTIVDDSKAASGIFTVDNLGVQFQATSMDKSFKVNDQVYVTVPNNNFDAQKIIIGKKEDFTKLQEQWKDPFSYLEFKYQFDDDSAEVEITPTGDGRASNKTVKRIILDDDFDRTVNLTSSLGAPGLNKAGTLPWDAEKFTEDCLWAQTASAEEPHVVSNSYRQNINFKEFKRFTEIGWAPFSSQFSATSPNLFRALLYYKNNSSNKEFYQIVDLPQQNQIPTSGKLPNGFPYWQEPTPYTYWYSNSNTWILSSVDSHLAMPFYITENGTDKNLNFLLFYNKKQYRPILLAGLKNIVITVDIQSDITFEDNSPSTGTYDFICQLIMVNQNDPSDEKTVTMTMASSIDFLGDPYNYFDYFTQQVVFDITNYQDYIVNKIEFSIIQNGDFANIDSGIIKIKNPKIYFGLPVQETTIGYKSYVSMFEQSHEYYQKTTPTKLIYLQACLEDIPPTNPGLEADGPFNMTITTYPKTTDTTIVPGTTYYKIMYGSYEPVENPKETELSQYYVQVDNSVLRYKPKIYIKNEDNEFVQDSDIKYFDQIYKTSNYDWDNNLYSWDAAKKQWYIKADDSPQNPAPRRDFYVCFPKNRKMSMYMGTVDSEDKEVPPQVGIASDDNNVDVVLVAGARDSNVLVSTADRNSKISIQAADRSSMELTNEAITLAVNGAVLELTEAKLEALIALLDNN